MCMCVCVRAVSRLERWQKGGIRRDAGSKSIGHAEGRHHRGRMMRRMRDFLLALVTLMETGWKWRYMVANESSLNGWSLSLSLSAGMLGRYGDSRPASPRIEVGPREGRSPGSLRRARDTFTKPAFAEPLLYLRILLRAIKSLLLVATRLRIVRNGYPNYHSRLYRSETCTLYVPSAGIDFLRAGRRAR